MAKVHCHCVHFQLGFLLFYSTLQCISLQLKQSSSLRNKPQRSDFRTNGNENHETWVGKKQGKKKSVFQTTPCTHLQHCLKEYTNKCIHKYAILFFEFFKNIECFFSIKVGHLITLLQILYKLMPGYITVGVSEGEKLATILLYPNDKYSIDYSLQHCVFVLKTLH